jgi:hypothetical protein
VERKHSWCIGFCEDSAAQHLTVWLNVGSPPQAAGADAGNSHDGIDASELLEHWDEHRQAQLWPVAALDDCPVWVAHSLADLNRFADVLKLLVKKQQEKK